MSGPWEQYAQPGPWAQYQPQSEQPRNLGPNGASWGGMESAASGYLQGLGDEVKAFGAATKESLSGGLPFGEAYDQSLSMYRGARDQYREQNPGKALAAEAAGGIASGIPLAMATGSAVGAVPVIGRIAQPMLSTAGRMFQNAAAGGAAAGLYGFNEGEGGFDERAANAGKSAAIGGLTGALVPAAVGAVGRVMQPVRSALNPEMSRLANVAASEGIPLTAAQQTGSKPLQIMESVFGNMPFTAGPQKAIQDAQRAAFNSAVLKRAGVEADNAAPEVLQAAQQRLGGEFNRLAQGNAVALDDAFLNRIGEVRQNVTRDLAPDQAAIVNRYIDDLIGPGRGVASPTTREVSRVVDDPSGSYRLVEDVTQNAELPGVDYQRWRSAMTSRARKSSDPALASSIKDVRNALDDAATRSISPEDSAAWEAARRQYANLKTIEKAMGSSTAGATEGNIMPTALSQAVKQGNGGYARGAGDLNELARVGRAFVRDNVPDSGTAQRMLMQNLLTGGVSGGVGYVASDDPTTALGMAGLALGGPRVAQMAYNSAPVRNYLTNTAVTGALADQTRRSLARILAQGSGEMGAINYNQRP